MREITKDWMKDNLRRFGALSLVILELIILNFLKTKVVDIGLLITIAAIFSVLITAGPALWLVRYDF